MTPEFDSGGGHDDASSERSSGGYDAEQQDAGPPSFADDVDAADRPARATVDVEGQWPCIVAALKQPAVSSPRPTVQRNLSSNEPPASLRQGYVIQKGQVIAQAGDLTPWWPRWAAYALCALIALAVIRSLARWEARS